ncbi:MAG: hypothetical protein ACKOAS_08040 [Verrucomicrobiota bacterium]
MKDQDSVSLTLPDFPEPMADTSNRPLDWSRAMDELEPVIRFYLEHYDSPEERWRSKNPEPFII